MRLVHLTLAVAAAGAAPALSQNGVLIAQGDVLPGYGTVADIGDIAIDAAGNWAVSVWLEGSPANQQALVVNGSVLIGTVDPLPGQAVSFVNTASLDLDPLGVPTWVAKGVSGGGGLYSGLEPVLLPGVLPAAPGIPPGTAASFFGAARPFAPGDFAHHVLMTGPSVNPSFNDLLLRVVDQPAAPPLVTVLAKSGDVLPGQTQPIRSFSEALEALAVNASGQLLFAPRLENGEWTVYLDGQKLAQTGEPSVVFGRNWVDLERIPVALNDAGDHAFGARLSGPAATDGILVWNGIKVVQEGDDLPAVAPFEIDRLFVGTLTTTRLRLTTDGSIAWFAGWNAAAPTADLGLFLDHELVLKEGSIGVSGYTLVDLLPDGLFAPRPVFDMVDDGSTFALRARLDDGRVAAVRVDVVGSATPIPDCTPNSGGLESFGQLEPGQSVILSMSQAQAVGAHGMVAFSTARAFGVAPCGVPVPGLGEVHVSLEPAHFVGFAPALFPATPALSTLVATGAVPDEPAIHGLELFAQGLWIDPSPAASEPLRGTNALALVIGQ